MELNLVMAWEWKVGMCHYYTAQQYVKHMTVIYQTQAYLKVHSLAVGVWAPASLCWEAVSRVCGAVGWLLAVPCPQPCRGRRSTRLTAVTQAMPRLHLQQANFGDEVCCPPTKSVRPQLSPASPLCPCTCRPSPQALVLPMGTSVWRTDWNQHKGLHPE